MYFAALRPEEAVNLKRRNLYLSIPEPTYNKGTGTLEYQWGEIHLEKATPEIGAEWTDSGSRSEEWGLKHRNDNTGPRSRVRAS
jgi:hypothetical protein